MQQLLTILAVSTTCKTPVPAQLPDFGAAGRAVAFPDGEGAH